MKERILAMENQDQNPLQKSYKEIYERDKRYSILDGMFSHVMLTVFGGAYLTGFGLALGMEQYQIGLLVALPALANLVQLLGPLYIRRVGGEKQACLLGTGMFRLNWLIIALLPLLFYLGASQSAIITIFLVLLALSGVFAALSNVSWMGWISSLIKRAERGRFFGRRNMYTGISAMVSGLLAGLIIDNWRAFFPELEIWGFSLAFLLALGCGVVSWLFLRKISSGIAEGGSLGKPVELGFLESLKLPLQDQNFRYLVTFSMAWAFAVGLSAPFFSVYMIVDLSIPFTVISLLALVSGATNIIGMKYWGQFVDRIGSKSLLYYTSLGAAGLPLIWIMAGPQNYNILWGVNFFAGLIWSGLGLATSLLLMQLAREEYKVAYYGLFAAATGMAAAVAPVVGGVLAGLTSEMALQLNFLYFEGLHFIFILTSVLRVLSLSLLIRVELEEQLSIQELVTRGMGDFYPLQRVRHLTVMGVQSVENLNLTVSRGLLYWESQLEDFLIKSRRIWENTGNRAEELDNRLEDMVSRTEEKESWLLEKIAAFFQWLDQLGENDEQ